MLQNLTVQLISEKIHPFQIFTSLYELTARSILALLDFHVLVIFVILLNIHIEIKTVFCVFHSGAS